MEFHEVANIFPMMSDEEFQALVADIKANGQIEPVWTYQGKIIDGRNRYKACVEVGIEPRIREWNGEETNLLPFILSLNLQRRHLSSSQKAMLAVVVEEYLAKEAEKRMLAGKKADPVQKVVQGKASDQAARIVGTNRQYVLDAKKVMELAPELDGSIRRGDLSLPEAKKVMLLPKETRHAVLGKVQERTSEGLGAHPGRAIRYIIDEVGDEIRRKQAAERQAQQQAWRESEAGKKQQDELRQQAERLRKEEEERRKTRAEQEAANASEIRATLNNPSNEQERTLLYAVAREVNRQMRQAALDYLLFLKRFDKLAGWVNSEKKQQPEDWYRHMSSYYYAAQNSSIHKHEGDWDIVNLYLNFHLRDVGGGHSWPLIDIDALQRWFDDPSLAEDSI